MVPAASPRNGPSQERQSTATQRDTLRPPGIQPGER